MKNEAAQRQANRSHSTTNDNNNNGKRGPKEKKRLAKRIMCAHNSFENHIYSENANTSEPGISIGWFRNEFFMSWYVICCNVFFFPPTPTDRLMTTLNQVKDDFQQQ